MTFPGEPREWCVGCEPEVDPIKEFVVEKRCHRHQVSDAGSDDALANDIYKKRYPAPEYHGHGECC